MPVRWYTAESLLIPEVAYALRRRHVGAADLCVRGLPKPGWAPSVYVRAHVLSINGTRVWSPGSGVCAPGMKVVLRLRVLSIVFPNSPELVWGST